MKLIELLKVITYTNLEDHIEITLFDERSYDNDHIKEFYNIKVTPHNIIKYADYKVTDVGTDGNLIQIMIEA